ncbi:hypothetical protein Metfor_1009 [Methanoregula formicica SMSP]|uniref:Uncharacterized protein n=1 Tax=Methanoregula formicica (strain DSM 22288 / NBRC 105244 / SMSP) TaxID=593750 RepID=L0HE49_METFS|nr:hypothetical protein Metfor_1009 [Methanoregula formicica SMSP]
MLVFSFINCYDSLVQPDLRSCGIFGMNGEYVGIPRRILSGPRTGTGIPVGHFTEHFPEFVNLKNKYG